jgi:tRNA (pseudouridine54-N1)-methyltransferase
MMDGKGVLRFVLILPSVPETGQFILRDLPGSGGRVDILCRSLAACFDWGPATWPKSMLELVAIIADKIALRVRDPGESLPRGEVQWADAIRRALEESETGFVYRRGRGLHELLAELPQGHVWALEEAGEPFRASRITDPRGDNTFIVGDHRGFDSQIQRILDDHSIYRLSIGNTSYLSSHCVAAIVSKFERMVE